MIDLQKIIETERGKRKLTVEALARGADISLGTAYRFKQGKPVESDTLEKILNFLGAEIKFKRGKK